MGLVIFFIPPSIPTGINYCAFLPILKRTPILLILDRIVTNINIQIHSHFVSYRILQFSISPFIFYIYPFYILSPFNFFPTNKITHISLAFAFYIFLFHLSFSTYSHSILLLHSIFFTEASLFVLTILQITVAAETLKHVLTIHAALRTGKSRT